MKRIPSTVLVFIILSGFFITCKVVKPTYFSKRIEFNLTGVLADSSADIIPLNLMKATVSGDTIKITGANKPCPDCEVVMVAVPVKKPPHQPGCTGCGELTMTYLDRRYFKLFNPIDKVSLTYRALNVPSKFLITMNALINKELNLKAAIVQ